MLRPNCSDRSQIPRKNYIRSLQAFLPIVTRIWYTRARTRRKSVTTRMDSHQLSNPIMYEEKGYRLSNPIMYEGKGYRLSNPIMYEGKGYRHQTNITQQNNTNSTGRIRICRQHYALEH
jgi:hypothetical protein